jgi:hypothetical protein
MNDLEKKLDILYEFVCQGTTSMDDSAKAAFAITKTRFETLFPNLFPKRDLKAENAELDKDVAQLRAELASMTEDF